MTQKPYLVERRDWLDELSGLLWPHKLVENLKNIFKIEISEGYQDETGFHFGPQPVDRQNH